MTPQRPTSSLRSLLALLALSPVVACGGSASSQFVTTDVLEAGEECSAGGVVLTIGQDDDGDGVLTGAEVTDSQVLCAGDAAASFGSLVTTTSVEPGELCQFGGLQVDAGLDNGDGEGMAGDGVLQEGEIDTTDVVCFTGLDPRADLRSPGGPAGTDTIDFGGGDGDDCGGDGGEMSFGNGRSGTNGSVRIFASGTADAGFTLPAMKPEFGEVVWTVSQNTAPVRLVDVGCDGVPDDASGLSVGEFYMIDCPTSSTNERSFWLNAATGAQRVTGLDVAAGVTLTIPHAGGAADFNVSDDVRNAGTITSTEGADSMDIDAEFFYGVAGSLVQGSGLDGDAGIEISFDLDGAFVSAGDVLSNGHADGDGGVVAISAEGSVYNTGRWSVNGGGGTEFGSGGSGGVVAVEADRGGMFNSGVVNGRGGNGSVAGGDGGVLVFQGYFGVRNSGAIDMSAGSSTAGCASNCTGGDGASRAIGLFASLGDVRNNAPLTVNGGNGGTGGRGGNGGTIEIGVGSGSIWVSGSIDATGGVGESGGGGGEMEVYAEQPLFPGNHITFLGYATVQSAGGNAPGSAECVGGEGGFVTAFASCGSEALGGGVVIEPDVVLDGGVGFAGGSGGLLFADACGEEGLESTLGRANAAPLGGQIGGGASLPEFGREIWLHGVVAAKGGAGADGNGGQGGIVSLRAMHGVVAEKPIQVFGGASTGADGGDGGEAGAFATQGDATFAAFNANGGNAPNATTGQHAGDGGEVEVFASGSVTVTGATNAKGGNAPDGDGGDGGWAFMLSGDGGANVGGIDVSGGAGVNPGSDGEARVDGVRQ